MSLSGIYLQNMHQSSTIRPTFIFIPTSFLEEFVPILNHITSTHCVRVCVCVCVCVCARMCVPLVCVCVCLSMCMCSQAYMFVHTGSTYVHVCAYRCICTRMCLPMCICKSCTCLCVSMCVVLCVLLFTISNNYIKFQIFCLLTHVRHTYSTLLTGSHVHEKHL